ncbi:MAG: thiamine pyrophosphate-binding protein [Desulfotomaculaceae bacterium]|nr:thiamine pyrophosphate-binding protein [Desulfotomaculaceae bacterium]
MPTQRNVAAAIVEQLDAWGVHNAYGLVGDDIFHIMDALAHQDKVHFYHVKHEETAALMASTQAKLNGQVGICIADGGPGTLHLMNGLADACTDHVPVLAITGQVNLRQIGTNAKQYIDQQSLMRPLAAYSTLLCNPSALPQVMESAYRTAVAGRSVAHVSIPMDVLPMPCGDNTIPYAPYLHTEPASSTEVILGALEIMRRSQRPVILVGAGGRKASEAVGELALRWGAAVVNTLAGTGVTARSHPLYAGGVGHAGSPASSKILQQADLCLIVGANWWPQEYVPKSIPIIQIDINPANVGATTPVTYGLVGDAGKIIAELTNGLDGNANQAWRQSIQTEISAWLKELDSEAAVSGTPVNPAFLIRALQNTAPDDAIISLDTGDHTVWFGRVFRPVRQQVLLSGKWRTMGYGLPAAMAAAINRPNQKSIALVGDGGFAMTMSDFLTAVRYNLPITVIVVNNNALAMEKNKMRAGGLLPEGTSLHNPDFARYAADCGGLGLKVGHSADLEPALREAINSKRPSLLDVDTSDLAVPGTKLPS